MNKQDIIDQLLNNVREEIDKAKEIFENTKEFASEDDMQAESKWDTRSTEAKFLASGQQQRLEELKQELKLLEDIEIPETTDTVSIGSLVKIGFNGTIRNYFMSPTAGGTQIKSGDEAVLVISVFSPLGAEAIGLEAGEEFEVETPKENRIYKVEEII